MRKFFPIICIALALCCVFALVACEDNTVKDFKLSFVVDGKVVSTISTDKNSSWIIPNDPQKEGYTFDGWYWDENGTNKVTVESLSDTQFSKDMSVYAKFSAIDYSITYVANGGAHSNVATYTIEDTISLSTAEKAGYTFDGWFSDSEYYKKVTAISKSKGDVTLYAKFTPIDYTISYENTLGAENSNPSTFNAESETITLLPILKDDYVFVNWTDENADAITVISTSDLKNRTITANWKPCVDHAKGDDCKCTYCGKTMHSLGANCVCTVCGIAVHDVNDDCVCNNCGKTVHGIKDGAYCKHDDYVYFGSYPQTNVMDSDVTTALTALAGALPTEENAQEWTDYGYYQGDNSTTYLQSYMWYIDLEKDGVKYRGVYFTSYRLHSTRSKYLNDYDTYQDDNGYVKDTVYWFAYEPLKWRILTTSDGIATLLCENVIDTQNFYITGVNLDKRYIDGKQVFDNSFEYSTIRVWLNETFYNTAFDQLQQSIIQLTAVDNSSRSTNPDNNPKEFNGGNNYKVCGDTEDYIYLPSEQEVTTEDYGFDPDFINHDTVRQKQPTDYASAQGCYYECSWWLRSPHWPDTYQAMIVDVEGKAGYRSHSVDSTSTGVAPMLRIKL